MNGTWEEAKARSEALAEELFDIINGADEEFYDAIRDRFVKEHPTLQQVFVGLLQRLILVHARRARIDMRNEASIQWAKKVENLTEGYAGFPYI